MLWLFVEAFVWHFHSPVWTRCTFKVQAALLQSSYRFCVCCVCVDVLSLCRLHHLP